MFQTPISGRSRARLSEVFEYKPTDTKDFSLPLQQLLGLERATFEELESLDQASVIRTLSEAIESHGRSMSELDSQNASAIFSFILIADLGDIFLLSSPDKIFNTIMRELKKCSFSSSTKIELGHLILQQEGRSNLDYWIDLTEFEKKEVLERFQKDLDDVFPDEALPLEVEELKKFAFTHFSAGRGVPAIQHHFVLLGLLYAENPDIEAITCVMKRYLVEQKAHFLRFGLRVLRVGFKPPELNHYNTFEQFRPGGRTIRVLHPGGLRSIQSFLNEEISGANIDDEKPGLLVYPNKSVSDQSMVERAQIVAAQNMDFPAFLQLELQPNQIHYNDRNGECRIFSNFSLDYEAPKVSPLQPKVRCLPKERLQKLYSQEMAERIYESIRHPVTVNNPKDRVCRVLFPSDKDTSTTPIKVSEKSEEQLSSTDRQIVSYVFKFLLALAVIKMSFHLIAYVKSKLITQ